MESPGVLLLPVRAGNGVGGYAGYQAVTSVEELQIAVAQMLEVR